MTDIPDEAQQGARSVSFRAVHRFVLPALNAVKTWPMAGTAAWRALAHDHPAKWAALLDAAQHHVLRVELAQEAMAEASKAVSEAADWPAVARELMQLHDARKSGVRIERSAS